VITALLLSGLCATVTSAEAPQSTQRVSIRSDAGQAAGGSSFATLSADGRFAAFTSAAANLVPGDSNGTTDAFIHDRLTGLTERVSLQSSGAQSSGNAVTIALSADGRWAAFASDATDLVPGDTNGAFDVFLHDHVTGLTTRVSVSTSGAQGNQHSGMFSTLAISADGRFVSFVSLADSLVPNDTNAARDVFVHDRVTAETTRVSVDSFGVEGDGQSSSSFSDISHHCSADGRYITFNSEATNLVLGDFNNRDDVFVHDRLTGLTERVSVDSVGLEGNGHSYDPGISADGRFVVFDSVADDISPGDFNASSDVFVHDRVTRITTRVSLDSLGLEGDRASWLPVISSCGRFVAYKSDARNLVPGDTNDALDVFVHDRLTRTVERASVGAGGVEANGRSNDCAISADGRFVAFTSFAANLVAGDTNGVPDVFVRDRGAAAAATDSTILLAGAIPARVGFPLALSWYAAPPLSAWWLLRSNNRNGLIFNTHPFDLGAPVTVLAVGVHGARGSAEWTSGPLPPTASGITVFFEVAARDTLGRLYDSNALERVVQ